MSDNDRPTLSLPFNAWEKAVEGFTIVILFVHLGYLAINWGDIPPRVPVHYGFSGEPDGWGHKAVLLLLPGLSIAMYGLLTILLRYPHKYNYVVAITVDNAARQYRLARILLSLIKLELIILFGYLSWGSVRIAGGEESKLHGGIVTGEILTLFLTVGIYIIASLSGRSE